MELRVTSILLNFISLIYADKVLVQRNSTLHKKYSSAPHSEVLWFTQMPSLPLLLKNTESLPNDNCKKHLGLYYRALNNGALWAVQMFDSSAKNIYGTIDGHTRHLGSFDQCFRIATNVTTNGQLSKLYGRYCLVNIKYEQRNVLKTNTKLNSHFDFHGSFWEAIKERGDFRRIKRYILELALCVPSSCHAQDIQQILQESLIDFGNQINLNITVSIDEEDCHTREEETHLTFYGKLFGILLLFWMLIVICATYYDVSLGNKEKDTSGIKYNMVSCLSIRQNCKEIFTNNYAHRGLDSIHGIRILGMVAIIFGHSCIQYYSNPVINARDFELAFYKSRNMIFQNGAVLTDGFLAASGLLMAYNLLKELDNKKNLNYFKNLLSRYIRLTPVYCVIIFFNALIFPSIGSGPFWKRHVVTLNGHNCKQNWWTNLLYINNYVNSNEQCMLQSWFLAVNFQCSSLAPLIIYIFWKVPRKIGYNFILILIFLSGIPPFWMTYFYNADPFMKVFPYYRIITDLAYFYDYYIKTHMRLTPYLVGLIFGVFIYDYNFVRWRLPKIWSQILILLLGPVLGFYYEIVGYKFVDPNVITTPLETALYASIHRGAYAFSVCSVFLLLTVGDGLDVYYKLLNCGWMQPLSKLTFCAFIVHNVLQTYRVATSRTAKTFTYLNLALWDLVPELLWCFIMSLTIAIFVEVPFRKMEKQIIFKRESTMAPNKKENKVNGIKID